MSEWTRPAQPVRCVVELDKPLAVHRERGVLAQGDANANAIVAEVYSTAGKPYDLSGCTVQLIFVRPDNNALPAIDAEINGNTAIVTLPDSAYAMSGMYSLRMQLRKNGAERTIVWIIGEVKGTDVDGIADPEHVISIGDIMASAKEAQTAASNANTAAQRANAGAERAEQLQIDASGLAGDSNKLGGKAPEYYLPADELLVNGDLAIAQAGRPVYDASIGGWISGTHGNDVYVADRWPMQNDITYGRDGKINVITGRGFVQQVVDETNLKLNGEAVTLAIKLADGTIYVANGTIPAGSVTGSTAYVASKTIASGVKMLLIKTTAQKMYARLAVENNASVSFEWIRLLPGTYTAENLPPYIPKGYAVELAECRRYYRAETGITTQAYSNGYVVGVNYEPMRITPPTITITSTQNVYGTKTIEGETTANILSTIPLITSFANPNFVSGEWYRVRYILSADL